MLHAPHSHSPIMCGGAACLVWFVVVRYLGFSVNCLSSEEKKKKDLSVCDLRKKEAAYSLQLKHSYHRVETWVEREDLDKGISDD